MPRAAWACDKQGKAPRSSVNKLALAVVILGVYVLHQDVWFWQAARPLVFGFLPVGLAYHAAYCVLVAVLMSVLTVVAWPAHLDRDPER